MNSVEKRHSSRRSSHRKHSDGGYSDTSSGGSFLDETDREVSNLTDRAFRSLCIGDEAIYNDSDLPASSPSAQTGRQQAFCQSGQDCWNQEEMKRAAQESYGLQVQQYGQQEWMPGAESQGDPRWPGNLDRRTGGRGSATFQHALMDGSLHQRALNKEPLSLHSNGATEFGPQERRSRSRVSSLIRAFNSDGCRDGAGLDGHLKESNDEANWDKTALMTIQQELSELSMACGQNLSGGPFSPPGQYSSQESFYSSQVATAHMDSSSSFMRSSHSQHSMSSLYSPSSTFFIHSEYSPFRVWRAQDRFPFQHGDVSGYMQSSDFQKWYETPMYKELALRPETHRVPTHEQWCPEPPPRKPLEHVALPPAPRSSSTSTVMHKASAVQKRCESELAEFHNMRKRTRSLGTNRLPSQRPSTVSPTNEMSRMRGRHTTLNSINDLQHKFKMMTCGEHSVTAEMMTMMGNQHGILHRNDGFMQSTNSNSATVMAGEQYAHSSTCTAPLNTSHLHTPGGYSQQDVRTSDVPQYACSPPAMEHPPVRAESRGATPDIRLSSSYKTRATSLLFNLKDNRKRVKSTYSPPNFKGPENVDRNNQVIRNDGAEHRHTVINIPEFQGHSDLQVPQVVVQQRPSLDPHVASHHPFTGYHSPGVTAFNPQLTAAYRVQPNDYMSSGDYLAPPMQSEMFLHPGFNSYSQDVYPSNPLTHGYIQQQEDIPSFANDTLENNMSRTGPLVGHSYREENANKLSIAPTVNMAPAPQPESIYSTTNMPGLNVDYNNQTAYQMNMATSQQYYHESMRGEMIHDDRYEQVNDSRYAFTDLSSHESWEHQCQEQEIPFMDDRPTPQWEGEAPVLTENDQNAQFYQSMEMLPDILLPPPQEYASNNNWDMTSSQAQANPEHDESNAEGFPVYPQNTPYHLLSNQLNQVQQYSACSTQAIPGGTAANEQQLPRMLQEYRLEDNQQYGIMANQSTQKYSQISSTEQAHAKQKSYGHDDVHNNYMTTQESTQQIQQDVQRVEEDSKQYQQDSVKQHPGLNFKGKPLIEDKIQCNAKTPFLATQEQHKQHANVNDKLVPGGDVKEEQQTQTEICKKLEWAQTLQTTFKCVRAGIMEETVTCGATGAQKEQPTTQGMSASGSAGQPHVELTTTDKLEAVRTSEEKHTNLADDTQVRAPQEEEQEQEQDQGIKSQRSKDESTMLELKEGSAAGEPQVEVAPKECIETIRVSPDGNAKGEVLVSREPAAGKAKEGQMKQITAGVIKTKQSEQVQIDAGAPVEHIKAQLSQTATEKTKPPQMEGTKAVHIKVEDDIKEEGKDELLSAGKINAEPSKVEKVNDPLRTKQSQAEKGKANREEKAKEEELNKAVAAREEQTHAEDGQVVKPEKCPTAPPRLEYAKVGHAKAKREQAEKRMEHSIVSLLIRKAEKEKLKQEPDKVEKVKTELAKAKAELAQIKEKMREEQKENQTSSSESKAVGKNVLQKEKSPPPYQQTEETPVKGPVDEYERVREKYGFSTKSLTNIKPPSANGVTSPSQDMDRPAPNSDKSEEATDDNKPRGEEHCQSKAATKEQEAEPSTKNKEVTENQYVYNESSKEFKLSNPSESSSLLETKERHSEIHIDDTSKDEVMNAKPEPVRAHIDVTSQPVVSYLNPTKCHSHERRANQIKDTYSAPPRALSHKERAQTKQEILTSKIKAHAEKEISAIKEKHFGSGKSAQQRLPSLEATKSLDKNIPSSIAPRAQQTTIQLKNSNPANIVASLPVMSSNAATTTSLGDSQVRKQEPLKSVKDTVKQPPVALHQTKNNDKRNEELKQREEKHGTKATSEIKEQNPVGLGKEELLKGNSSHQAAEDVNAPQMTKDDPPPSKPEESSKGESNQTEHLEDAPSLKLVLGQNEAPAAAEGDSLQIMGIMVTVRARTESVSVNDEDGCAKKPAPEKAQIEPSDNLVVEMTKENIAQHIFNGKAEEARPLTSPPTVGTEHTKVGAQNHLESTRRLENKTADLTDKRLTTQKESSVMRKTSQSHAVHREDSVAHQEDSSTGMKSAPNKPGKTQPILFKQGKITEKAKIYTNKNKNVNEAKSNITVNAEVGNDPSLAKAMETGINSQMSPVKSDLRSSKIQSHPPSEKYQTADHVTSAKADQVQDRGSVPLLVDKSTHPSLPEVDQQKKNTTSSDFKGHENVHISVGKQGTRTQSGENSQDGGNVHIGSIAIRVVEKHNQETAVKELVVFQSVAETMNTERDEDRAIPLPPAIKPLKQMNENVIQQVQHMPHDAFSSGSSNLKSKMTHSSETTQNEDETHQRSNIAKATVDDPNNTKIQATEAEYFQLQGVTEIHKQNIAKLGGAGKQSLAKEHTEEFGVPRRSTGGDVSVNTELSSQQEAKQVANKDKVLDNVRKTTNKSDSATTENMSTSGKREQDSKNISMLPERQPESNQRVNIETEYIQRQSTQNTFHASGKERQTMMNSAVGASKEQPNYKQEAKSKPRVSTVPEISAIADYARLKVIAADDEPDTMQEFPPNKKEGFFPMIQSRHSRRPVFTAETPERRTVTKKTEKSKEPELSHKIDKEPKSLVFSAMEQDHKRTGMFKLREKENALSDVKTKEDKVDSEAIHTPNNNVTSQGTPADFTYWSQDAATSAEPTAISSANINKTNTSSSQYFEQPNNSAMLERPEGGEVFSKQRALPQKANSSQQQAMPGEMFTREQSKGEGSNVITNEAKSKENEAETADKQRRENAIIQQINEERRAALESQKREERRAREREARVARLEEERREKQREADKIAEEERTARLLREKAAQEELEKKRQELEEQRVAEEERRQKRREEERRKKETEERIAAQIQEEMRRAKQREEEAQAAKELEDKRRDKQREDRMVAQIQEERRAAQVEEERREREEQEERAKREEEEIRMAKHREIEQRIKEHEEMRAAELEQEQMKRRQEEERRVEREKREEQTLPAPREADQPLHTAEHEEEQTSQKVELEEEQTSQKVELEEEQTSQKREVEEEQTSQTVAQRKAALLTDALQYYAITSSSDPKDKHRRSPVSRQRRVQPTKQESTPDESLSRPHVALSPAPVPPRSNTSSPAPGAKPTMFRVKDNTFRVSSLTKSVKPRLHKSFGEDFRVGSPHGDRRGSDRAEEEQDRARRSAGTPIHQDTITRSNRLPSVKESQELPPQPPPPPLVPEPPAARAEYRPCSRRSIAPDEEDSRSYISNMSEDVESFATSAGDLADFRGFGDHDRPESVCSFSSDVARSLGKPPSVPPKSDKALKRAQRLTTRRIKKELTKTGPGPEVKPLHAASSSSSSSGASELRSSYRHARASPHFSAPFSLSHAPASASSVASSRAEMPAASHYSHASPHAIGSVASPHATGPVITPHTPSPACIPLTSPHATGPISLPIASPHATAPVSLPIPSPRHPPTAYLPVAPKTITSTPSSPVLRRRGNPPGPVTQYHVEPGYAQSYPLTQPKVLQDPGSGQYFVVDMPVQVKTKTFFDPETGKYVQLNVRQSTQGGFQPQPQQAGYPQPQIPPPQLHVQPPPQIYPQVATPGKSFVVYPGYSPGPQSMPVSTLPAQRSYSGMSIPDTLTQPLQNYAYHGNDETPYMDTACKTDTIHDTNKVNHRTAGPHGKYPDRGTNHQLQNSTSGQSGLQPRDIITMSELDDFMEVSDW